MEMAGSASRAGLEVHSDLPTPLLCARGENNRAIGDTALGQTQGGIGAPPFGVVCAMGGVGRSGVFREHRKWAESYRSPTKV